jgi:hypothetical protein
LSIYSDLIRSDSPVGYWTLNELTGTISSDLSGGGRDASIFGGVTKGILSPIRSDPNAMQFDGVNGRLQVASTPSGGAFDFSGNQSYSIELWAYAIENSPNAVWRRMIEREIFGTRNGYGLLIGQNTSIFSFERWAANVGAGTGNFTMPLGFWCYLLGTYDGVNLKAYGNNILKSTVASAGAVTAQAATLNLGADGGGSGSFWKGGLNQIAIYNYVLSTTQRTNHFLAASQIFKSNAHIITSRDAIGVIRTR